MAQLLGWVRRVALDALKHQDVPFEHVVELVNPPRTHTRPHSSLPDDVRLAEQRGGRFEAAGNRMSALEALSTAPKFDLTLPAASG